MGHGRVMVGVRGRIKAICEGTGVMGLFVYYEAVTDACKIFVITRDISFLCIWVWESTPTTHFWVAVGFGRSGIPWWFASMRLLGSEVNGFVMSRRDAGYPFSS